MVGRFPTRVALLAYQMAAPLPPVRIAASNATLVLAGLTVGLGTGYGAGCTSGHGVCGVSLRSRRSLVATARFMAAGFAVLFVVRPILNCGDHDASCLSIPGWTNLWNWSDPDRYDRSRHWSIPRTITNSASCHRSRRNYGATSGVATRNADRGVQVDYGESYSSLSKIYRPRGAWQSAMRSLSLPTAAGTSTLLSSDGR
jgi:hypothetical protein